MMSNSLRVVQLRRVAGHALLVACVGLAIDGAVAQQQPSLGTNVNVISGTGKDGDWTLQRQNEPTIACSSRNPQNCLAGANDYRTVDIPFPDVGEKMTGDAWLGWYTTKNGGLTWRTRLLPGYPQDISTVGLASPLKGYQAGADPIIRSGTNGLFYYGGLAFQRDEGEGSAIFVARFIDNNNQEGISGEPIAYIGTSIVQRIGNQPVAARLDSKNRPASQLASRSEREKERERAREREREREKERERERGERGGEKNRGRDVRAGAEQLGEQMVDKPWMAVDIPRAGATTCTIGGGNSGIPLQSFPGGRVYMAYALFDGPGEEQGRIMFTYSADCARTWSPPRVVSRVQSPDVNDDGVANSVDVSRLQASVGRSCGQTGFNPNADINNDCTVNAIDLNYVSRNVGQPVPKQPRLSQGASLAIDPQTGALQIAWRQFNDGVLPDAIVTVRSTNGGVSVSPPKVVAALGSLDQSTTPTSFRTNAYPSVAIDAASRVHVAWSSRGYAPLRPDAVIGDARIVLSTSTNAGTSWSTPKPIDNQEGAGHQIMPALTFAEGKLNLVYYDLREDRSQLFGQFVDEGPILSGQHNIRSRHTIDVRGAQADPADSPAFTSFQVTKYRQGTVPGQTVVQQLEFSPPNLPLFQAGTSPFIGDYLDTAPAVPFVRNGNTWSFNTAPSGNPVFHAIWTDNRDVRPPANGNWTQYTAPNPPFGRPALSGFDPTQALQPCVPGQAAMKNQNIYTARITQGLVVGALGNSRPLSPNIQRSFPVFAQNNGDGVRSYRLTIENQPVGGDASLAQFQAVTTLDVSVPARSTVARTVFVRSTDPRAQVRVNVTQIVAPAGGIVQGGQQGTIVLNPDPTNPDIANPDIANPDIANPDIANPDIANPDIANPDIANPDIANAEVFNPDIANPSTRNPDIANPDIANPDIANPDIANVTILNPDIANPDIANPDIANPDIANPDIANPDIANPDIANGSLSDTTWFMKNTGNAAASFTVKLGLNSQLPTGFKSQLIAHKVYKTPVVQGCDVLTQPQTVLLANIPNPRFVNGGIANPDIANPDIANPDIANLTIALAPGDIARITLRVVDPDRTDAVTFNAAQAVTPAVVAQAVSTPAVQQGVTQPTVAAPLADSAPAPGGTSGGAYNGSLQSSLPGTWTVVGGNVPPGLTVNETSGAITGTPTTPGTYTFTARFQSTTGIVDYRSVTITVGGVGAAANVAVSSTGPGGAVTIGVPFAFNLNVSNAGPASAINVRLTDTLPQGTQFVSATTSVGSCTHSNGRLLCDLGTLASGASGTIVVTVQPTVAGTHTNQAVVTTDTADPSTANNTATSTAATGVVQVTPCTTVCFSGPTPYLTSNVGTGFGAEKGDFNEDGHIDLIYGPADVNTVGIVLGNGAGGFGAPTFMTIPGDPGAAALADFNHDGHLDLAITSGGISQIWVYLGNGQGGFGPLTTVTLPSAAGNVVAGDFNRDGNVDLIVSGNGAGPLLMLLNGVGNGTFAPATTLGTSTGESSLVAEDLNRDGNLDLIVSTTNALVTFIGAGNGTFLSPTTTPVQDIAGIVKVGDVTGDGIADVIVGTVPAGAPSEIRIYVSNGSNGFTPGALVGPSELVNDAPTPGDLDSDGDIDIVWSRIGGGIGIQLNDGLGNFAAPIYLSTPQSSQPIVADFNGDGRPDLAAPVGTAFMGRSELLVFLNTCDQPPADLSITMQAPTGAVVEGSNFTQTIQVTNNGPNPATGVQLDFTQHFLTEFVSFTGAPGTCTLGPIVSCQLGTLASGQTATYSVVLRAASGGTVSSTAGVTATTSDPNPGNNAAFTAVTVTAGASTFVVTNTNAGGPGSLRLAIVQSSDGGPRDTIVFNIPGAGVHTIRPTAVTPLPTITQPVVIDATTQPGYAGTPLIEISGENAGFISGLIVSGGNSIVRGLAVIRFPRAGIFVPPGSGSGNTFEANYVGITSGGAAAPNAFRGIDIQTANNTIGGLTPAARNVISGNGGEGILITGAAATSNTVLGNYIGTNVAATAPLGNGGAGIIVQSSGNTIGGTAPGSSNVVAGNTGAGITLTGAGATSNQVLGNFIGTNAGGSAAVANGNNGINISGGASNNTVGGSTIGARNIVSGNTGSGIRIQDATTTGNVVRGNYVGTNAAGTARIANGINGIETGFATAGNTVGGPQAADGNLISGNTNVGLAFFTVGAGGNQALSNLIGTDATGTQPLGNGQHGVLMQSSDNRVGSLTATIGNVIAFNGGYGVRVDTGTGNAIVNNSIFSNGLMGIDLVPGGLTPNDPGDVDTGSNTLINFPVLSSARTVGANILVQVALSPTPVGQFQVHFYANAACDPTGFGEGQTLIGVVSGTGNGADANLEASFASSAVPTGSLITATITDSNGNTSEFSACAPVATDAGTANLSLTSQDSPDPVAVGSPLTYTIGVSNLGPDAATNVTVTDILPANVTLVSANASIGTCTGTTTVTCNIGTIANGASITVGIVVTPTATGVLVNNVTTAGSGTDPNTANNSATATTVVQAAGPITYVVTTTNDSGAGSLRQAILDANARFGGDTISFSIPGTGVQTITPATGLPPITDPVILDATTQPGYAGTPLIELNGAAATGANGFSLNTSDSVVRGFTINRFAGNGISIQGTNNRIEANWLGLNAAGTAASANGNGIIVNSSGNTIGGATASVRNVISGNTISGVQIASPAARGNAVTGNYIGTDPAGTVDLGNLQAGLIVIGEANVIGGLTPAERNVISGNNQTGVRLALGATANTIQGNFIGTDVSGTLPLGNGEGVSVGVVGASIASSNFIGGLAAGAANRIAFNSTAGVSVVSGGTNNAILGNSITGNGGIGIDLNANGVSANDAGDADQGANDVQNFPVLSAAPGGVTGSLNSIPNGTFRIEFFGNTACDLSGNGEGATFLGAISVTTDATGNASIPFFTATTGQVVTATATDASNNTSEFSTCVQPQAASTITVAASDPAASELGPNTATFTVTRSGATTADRDVTVAIGGTATNGVDYTITSAALVGPATGSSFALRIPAGQSSVAVTVTPIGDAVTEVIETVTFTAEGSAAVATIVDQFTPLNFVVTTTADSGPGSLRQAMLDSNANPAQDIITFDIPGTGVHTITPATPLPIIADPVILDATSQPGYLDHPLIELNGTNAGPNANAFFITASNTTIRGFAINRYGTGGASPQTPGGAAIVIQLGGSNFIQSNFLGTDPTGTIAVPNRSDGIFLDRSANNAIGGAGLAANVLSGNGRNGITLSLAGTTGNLLLGNYIGTNATGTAAVPNTNDGVAIFDAPSNLIGVAGRNIISGNLQAGITLSGAANANVIANNVLGANAATTGALANGSAGVIVTSGASDNVIGGVAGVNGNIIAFNTQSGVRVITGVNNSIRGNSIFSNGQLGIDLGVAGVTANDAGDADGNGNNQQNFPVLTATPGGVQGTLNSTPNGAFIIEYFGNTACDASARGEGATYLGTVAVVTDAAGNATLPTFSVNAGVVVTATATDATNNTSEFSNCIQVTGGTGLSLNPTSGQQGTSLTVTLTGTNTTFAQGTTVANFGQGITVNSLTVTNATAATANITISPTAFSGGRTVTVTTGAEVVTNSFSVTAGSAALSTITPNTAQQGQANVSLTITGQNTHFVQGTTSASFGGDITVNVLTINSPTSATANITLNNFATPGIRSVTLSTDGENATLANGFTVTAGTPRLTLLSPATGQQGQQLNVTVTGLFTSFANGTTTADFGAGIAVNSVTINGPTTATVNVSISPLAAIGSRTVTLTTGAQSASSLDTGSFFNVTAGNAAIAQVSPATGRQAESATVTVTGSSTHFASGSTVFSFGGGITVTSVTVNGPTSATLNISIAPTAALGNRDVTATTLGETATLVNAFSVTAGLPSVALVSPSTGRQAQTLDLNVTGQLTHFVNGATVVSFGAGITVNSVTVSSQTQAVVNVTISPTAALGARTVVITTGAEAAQQVGGFTVTAGQATLFSVSPVSAVQGTNTTITLNGAFTNFTSGVTTAFFGSGISAGTVTVNGPTLASVPITIAANTPVGPRSVTVTTGSESVTIVNGFTVVQGTPTVTGIDPNAGQRGLTRNVLISGAFTNWQTGVTSVSYGPGVTVNSNVVNSATTLTTNITVDAAATLGPRDVVITTGTQVLTVASGFLVTDADTTAPSVLTISPPYGTSGVPLNPGITAEFNEPLNRATVNASTFQLFDTMSSTPIPATVTLDATGRVVRLVPSQLLAVSRQHYSYLTNAITDVAGNHFGSQINYFTTGFSTDTTGPTLRLTNPRSGDTDIGRNAKVTLQFDRPINAATRTTGLRIQSGGVNVAGTYVFEDGQRRIRFTPATQLAATTDFTVTLTSDLRDVSGNALTNPGSFVFTTGTANDTVAPVVTANSPAYNDAGVGLMPQLRAAFSEPINPITLTNSNAFLYNPSTSTFIKITITIAADRRSVLMVPDAPLAPSTQYYYYVSGFEDLNGNSATLSTTYFRTGTAADTAAPTVVSVDPANGVTGVPVNARVRVSFSEPIDATSIGAPTIQLTPAVSGTLTVSTDHTAVLFTPAANLSVSTTFTVQVAGVRDASGNLMSPVSSSFTTSGSSTADTTAPTVVSFSPLNAATNVGVSQPIVMTVSEPIRSTDFSESMRVFANVIGYGQVEMAGSYVLNAARTALTFTPAVPYPGSTQVTVYSNYNSQITDLAGNALQSITTSFTTAAAADTTAPTIVMVTPTDGTNGVGPQAIVTLTFSESLLPTTITNNTFALFAGGAEIAISVSRSSDNRTVFLSANLPFDSLITVVATGDVTDLAGNPLEDFSSTFTTASAFDSSRPQIVTQRPTGPGISPSTDITLFVSKPLDATTVPGAFYLSQNGVLVEGALTVSAGGTAIHFNPATNLTPGALIQIFVTQDAKDLSGNALYDYSGQFTVAPDPTSGAPTIVRSSPVAYSNNNPTNAVVDIEFSEPLLPETVISANIYMVNANGQPLAGTLALRNGNRIVRFTPAAALAVSNYNYMYLTNGLRDAQNTPFAGTNFYFYTGPSTDSTIPVVTSVAPPSGATNVGVNSTIRAYFNQGINPVTVTSGTLSLSSAAGSIPTSATFNTDNTVVTLVPQAPLPAATVMTLNLTGIEDAAGNVIAPQVLQFTTGSSSDTVRPSVIATNISASGAANVPTNTVFQVTFDEPMDIATVLAQAQTFLYDNSFGYRSGTASMSPDGLTFTFVPTAPLAVGRSHGIYLNLGYDLAGNQQVSFSQGFTTAFATDTTPPTIAAVNPAAGATAVPRNARVEIRFSESISSVGLSNVRLLSGGTTNVTVTKTLSDNNRVLTLRPSTLLTQNRSYTISVSGVRDTSNNVMAGTFTSTFTTSSRTDLVPPTVIGTNPSSEDHGVGTNVAPRVTFSEPVDPLLITSDTFRVGNASGGSYLDATVTVAADRRSATVTPVQPLLPFTRYYFQLSSIADVAGNSGGGTTSYFYTGAGSDTTPPVVSTISPPNGVPALPVNTRITVLMSEPIDTTSVSNASVQLTPAAPGTVTLAADRVTLTFTPSANLTPSTAYSVLVSGLRDTSSNTMSAATFGFTTAASATADTTAPAIVSRTPTNGSAGVGVNSLLTVTTSERITATAVGPSSMPVFAVLTGVGTFQLAGQYSVDSTGTVITFAVTGNFPANATIRWYTNNNSSIRDMAGLLLPNVQADFTTANVPDNSGPTVLNVTPTNGATGVGPYVTVTLAFSESISPNSVTNNTVVLFAGSTRLSPSISRSTDNRMVFLSLALPLDETITVIATSGVTDFSGNALTPFTSSFRTAPDFDVTRPYVVTQRPTGSSVAPTTPITLFLSEPINPATLTGSLYVSQNGELISGTASVGWSNQAITFTPTTPFPAQATIEIRLTDDVRDPAGNAVQAFYGSFAVASNPATTTPTLVRTNPVAYSQGNPTNVVLDLEFSEPLNPATVTAANVFVRDAANLPVAGTLTLRNNNRTVRFTPAANFAVSNYNYIYYQNLTDLQGTSVPSSNFYFYTGTLADAQNPSVAFINPASGMTNIGVNSAIRVTFSEQVNLTTLSPDNIVVSAGSPVATTFAIATGNQSVTLTPQLPLPTSANVTVSVTGVEDLTGRAVPATSATFTTGNAPDVTAPTVIATSTISGDPSVPLNSVFEWTYSEPVDAATVLNQTNVFYDYSVGYVPGAQLTLSTDARTVTLVPPTLAPGKLYAVFLGSVADLAGNVGGNVSISFTTTTAADNTPPLVVVMNPADGATAVPTNTRIRLAFNEPISATTLPNINILVSGLPLPVASRVLSNGDRVVTLTLTGLLAPNTAHTISARVRDRAGNLMPSAATSTFTTGSGVDLINLSSTVTASPVNNATGVAVGTAPSVTFTEAIDPTSVIYGGNGGVVLLVAATNQPVPITYSFSSDRRTVTMTPVSALAAGTQYRIQVSSATTDLAGNSFPTSVQFLFTTQP